jgi:hypothetical protein
MQCEGYLGLGRGLLCLGCLGGFRLRGFSLLLGGLGLGGGLLQLLAELVGALDLNSRRTVGVNFFPGQEQKNAPTCLNG